VDIKLLIEPEGSESSIALACDSASPTNTIAALEQRPCQQSTSQSFGATSPHVPVTIKAPPEGEYSVLTIPTTGGQNIAIPVSVSGGGKRKANAKSSAELRKRQKLKGVDSSQKIVKYLVEYYWNLSSLFEPAPVLPVPSGKQRFFCTFCDELGSTRVFKTKQD